jgi:hypothetical protein
VGKKQKIKSGDEGKVETGGDYETHKIKVDNKHSTRVRVDKKLFTKIELKRQSDLTMAKILIVRSMCFDDFQNFVCL